MAAVAMFNRILPALTRTTTANPPIALSFLRHQSLCGGVISYSRIPLLPASLCALSTLPNPSFSESPPEKTIFLDGCDFNHFLVSMKKLEGNPSRDEIIDYNVKTLAKVLGSEDEARRKIYSISTKFYYAFGAEISEEVSSKIEDLPGVKWVLADSYVNMDTKNYGGEPFINGKAVPYDPIYHKEWYKNIKTIEVELTKHERPRAKSGLNITGQEQALKLHAQLIKTGLSEQHPYPKTLIDAYGKCGLVIDALKLFDTLPLQDHGAWASVLSSCNLSSNLPHRSLSILVPILHTGLIPDHLIFSSLIKACGNLGAVHAKLGKEIHARFLRSSVSEDNAVKSSIVDMYSRFGLLNYGHRVFDSISVLTFIAWNSLISGYARSGQNVVALQLFSQSPYKNLNAFSSLISGLVEGGYAYEGVYQFNKMRREGVSITDPLVISSLLGACVDLAIWEFGIQLHGLVISLGHEACWLTNNALLDMYDALKDGGAGSSCLAGDFSFRVAR